MDRVKHILKRCRAWNLRDQIPVLAAAEICLVLLERLCYRDLPWLLALQVLVPLILGQVDDCRRRRRQTLYERNFREILQSMTISLQAGYSLENACRTAILEKQESEGFGGEWSRLLQGMDLNIPLEVLFYDFAARADSDDIYRFSTVMKLARGTGGNMVSVLRDSMEHLKRKLDTAEEIRVLLSGRIFEKNIMLLMPFLILLYLRLSSPAYVDCFYRSAGGHLVMTAVIAIVVACYYWTEKIMDIGV